jgi:large subunit ribosomal protein L23
MINNLNKYKNIDLIKYPLITDKTTRLLNNNQYTFIVDLKISKTDIKEALEFLFNVRIIKVNTLHLSIKKRQVGKFNGAKSQYKKAIVKLAKGYTIKLFPQI